MPHDTEWINGLGDLITPAAPPYISPVTPSSYRVSSVHSCLCLLAFWRISPGLNLGAGHEPVRAPTLAADAREVDMGSTC